MNVKQKIYLLRLIGHYSLNLGWLLVPYFIFKITGSVSTAAIAIAIESIPQFFFYLFGGAVVSHFGQRFSHIGLEAIKLFSIGLLFIYQLLKGNIPSIALVIMFITMASGLTWLLKKPALPALN